jgi:hypothetical protein
VKITDEAVEAAAKAVSVEWQNFVPSMRLALEAALRHLEGATAHLPNRHGESVTVDLDEVEPEGATPAIDREALEQLIDGAEHYNTCDLRLSPLTNQFGCSCLLADLRALLGGAS